MVIDDIEYADFNNIKFDSFVISFRLSASAVTITENYFLFCRVRQKIESDNRRGSKRFNSRDGIEKKREFFYRRCAIGGHRRSESGFRKTLEKLLVTAISRRRATHGCLLFTSMQVTT